MPLNIPKKIITPFATNGLKNAIPEASQSATTPGRASYTDGFPNETMQPIASGGVPPYGQDVNGILFELSKAIQYTQAGGVFLFDSAFASAIGGYPKAAIIQRPDGGFWRSTIENNQSDPNSLGAGWETLASGVSSVSLSSDNVNLTAAQASNQLIIFTGNLSRNITVFFPTNYKQSYIVLDRTTGSYSVTCSTQSGAGVQLKEPAHVIACDGVGVFNVATVTDSGAFANSDLSNLSSTGNGKFAKPDLSNVTKPYVTEAWKSADGTSWYQKFSDGLIMQAMTGGYMFTLPVPFKDSSYLVISSASYGGATERLGQAQTPTKTNTSVKFGADWAKVSFIAIGH